MPRSIVRFSWLSDAQGATPESRIAVARAIAAGLKGRGIEASEPFPRGESAWDIVVQYPGLEILVTVQRPLTMGEAKEFEWLSEVRGSVSFWKRLWKSAEVEVKSEEEQSRVIHALNDFLQSEKRSKDVKWFYPGFEGEAETP